MKAISILIVLFLFAVVPIPAKAQANCTDPGGCSVLSFAAYQNTVGIIQFGNTTGKVFLKKKRTLCAGSSCSSRFTMTAALVAPSQNSSSGVIASDLRPNQVVIVAQIRELNSNFTELLGINLENFVNNASPFDVSSKAKLDSGFPDFKGAGNNGLMHIAPGPGENLKFIHQILKQLNEDKLVQPSPLRSTTKPLASGTVDRELTLQIGVEITDNLNVRLTLQEINSNRKKSGLVGIVDVPPLDTDSDFERIPSSSVTPSVGNLPVVAHLFAHKRLKENDGSGELAIFITPVIIDNLQRSESALAPTLGPTVQLTDFKQTTIPSIEFFQTIAIDPKARFLLFTEYSNKCKKNILKYAALDPTLFQNSTVSTKALLKPKTLAGCGDFKNSTTGAYGIDVVNME